MKRIAPVAGLRELSTAPNARHADSWRAVGSNGLAACACAKSGHRAAAAAINTLKQTARHTRLIEVQNFMLSSTDTERVLRARQAVDFEGDSTPESGVRPGNPRDCHRAHESRPASPQSAGRWSTRDNRHTASGLEDLWTPPMPQADRSPAVRRVRS